MKNRIVALLLGLFLFIPFVSAEESPTRYEFEDGVLTGSSTSIKSSDNASGGKYVKNNDDDGTVTVTVQAEKDGPYDLRVVYGHSGSKNKTQLLYINDEYQARNSYNSTSSSTNFTEADLGIVMLKSGSNTISFRAHYGFQSYDYLTITPVADINVTASDTTLIDDQASCATRGLFNYLNSIYGKYTLSGQQEYASHSREDEFEYLLENTGKSPAIRGFDFARISAVMYGNDDGVIDRISDWVLNKKGIATVSWDIRVPKDIDAWGAGTMTGYSNATDSPSETNFDMSKIFVEGSYEKDYIDQSIENLSEAMKRLQDKDVPILFRMFQEAEGAGGETGVTAWFWWGMGGYDTYNKLYQYVVDSLKDKYGIHNVIYVANAFSYTGNSEKWYPGDDYVDIMGYSKYNREALTPVTSSAESTFYNMISMYNNKKMIGMSENGTTPSSIAMKDTNSQWLYFLNWYDNYLFEAKNNTVEGLSATYNAENVITLDELPDYVYTCPVEKEESKEEVKETDKSNPKTGDRIVLYLLMLAITFAGIIVVTKKYINS